MLSQILKLMTQNSMWNRPAYMSIYVNLLHSLRFLHSLHINSINSYSHCFDIISCILWVVSKGLFYLGYGSFATKPICPQHVFSVRYIHFFTEKQNHLFLQNKLWLSSFVHMTYIVVVLALYIWNIKGIFTILFLNIISQIIWLSN